MKASDLIIQTPNGHAVRTAVLITTWSGARYIETVKSLPDNVRLLTVDTSQHAWPLAKAWNYGINRLTVGEGYDAVVVLNDDVVLRPDTISNLVLGLFFGQYDRKIKPELLMATGRNTRKMAGDPLDSMLLKSAKAEWSLGPDFSCYCVDKRLLSVVGPFDEQFVPAYFEDNDMHRRIFLAGYEAAACTPYFHYGSQTIATDPERKHEIQNNGRFEENRRRYILKWGGGPGEEKFAMPYDRPQAGFLAERSA